MTHFTQEIKIDLPVDRGHTFCVTDFGANTHPESCNTAAFRSAIEVCKKNPGSVLEIPQGVYHFYHAPDGSYLSLHGAEDVTINGHHSELIFHTPVAYWDIQNCTRIHLKNLVMDWAWEEQPLASVGVVQAVAPDGRFLDVFFPACRSVPEDMEIRIVGPFDPKRYTPGCPGGSNSVLIKMNISNWQMMPRPMKKCSIWSVN